MFRLHFLLAAGLAMATATLARIGVPQPRSLDPAPDPYSCSNFIIDIVNQTDLNFYSACSNFSDAALFFIDHNFTGPFVLPNIKSLPEISSGYLGPRLTGDTRVDDGVTTVSMPDLLNVTDGGVLFGYDKYLTSVSLPKLTSINSDLVSYDSPLLRNVTLPSLETVTGAVLLSGEFDVISMPKLKSVKYMRVESILNTTDCIALGKTFSSLVFTPGEYDQYVGFTCWTPYPENTYASPVSSSSSTRTSATATKTGSTTSGTVTGVASSTNPASSTKASGATGMHVKFLELMLCFTAMIFLVMI